MGRARPVAGLLAAAAVFASLGLAVGAAEAGSQPSAAVPTLTPGMARLGDRGTFALEDLSGGSGQAGWSGTWGGGTLASPASAGSAGSGAFQVGSPELTFSFAPVGRVRDAQGVELAADGFQDALSNGLPDWMQLFVRGLSEQSQVGSHTVLEAGTGRVLWAGTTENTRSMEWDWQGGGSGTATNVSVVRDVYGGRLDCLYDLAARPHAIPLEGDVFLFTDCTSPAGTLNETSLFRAEGADRVGGVPAYRFRLVGGGLSVWLAPGIPYPIRLADASAQWTLTGFSPGGEARREDPQRGPATPWERTARGPSGPDPTGFPLRYPLARAVADGRLLLPDLDKLLAKPGAYLAAAGYAERAADDNTVRGWSLVASDGQEHVAAWVNRTEPASAAGLPDPLRDLASKPEAVRFHPTLPARLPLLSSLPGELATAGSLRARWESVSAEPAKGYGFAYTLDARGATQVRLFAGSSDIPAAPLLAVPGGPGPAARHHEATLQWDNDGNAVAYQQVDKETSEEDMATVSQALLPQFGEAQARPSSVLAAALAASPATVAGSAIAATLTGILVWLWPTLKGGLAGLFTRIPQASLLDHPKRRLIRDLVEAQPGIHFQGLLRASGLANGTLVHHVQKLVDAGVLRTRPNGAHTHFFLADQPPAPPQPPSAGARKVLASVRGEPGLRLLDVAVRTGLSPSTVSYHVQRLQQAGLLHTFRGPDGLLLRPA